MFRGLVSDLAWNRRRVQIPTCHWYPEGRWAVALLSALPSFSASFYFLSCLAILPPADRLWPRTAQLQPRAASRSPGRAGSSCRFLC